MGGGLAGAAGLPGSLRGPSASRVSPPPSPTMLARFSPKPALTRYTPVCTAGDVPREEPDRNPDRGSLGQEWPGPSLSPDPSPRTMPATARGQQTRSENNLVSSETTFVGRPWPQWPPGAIVWTDQVTADTRNFLTRPFSFPAVR